MTAFPQLAGKGLVKDVYKKAIDPVSFEVAGKTPEIQEAYMDEAMMEQSVSTLLDIYMIVEYKKSKKIGE